MAVTLKDVAELAGVSVKTVSNVVNGYSFVTEQNRQRVEKALATTGYRPNISARNLRLGRTGFLALIVPELGIPYFGELSALVIAAAHQRGWTVLVEQTFGTREREHELVAGLGPHVVDGAILSPEAVTAADLQQVDPQFPLVLIGEHEIALPMDHVGIDNVAAARDAVAHLLATGRRRIAAIGELPHRGTAMQRLRGYHEALHQAGVPAPDGYVVPVEQYHRADGAAAMQRLLDLPEPPDAVFCLNDQLAVGALHRALSAGRAVPEDVAIMGFDGSEETEFTNPPLSTVLPDKAGIANAAVELVSRRFEDRASREDTQEVEVPYRLELRETTRRL